MYAGCVSDQGSDEGRTISLFKRLADAHSMSVVRLRVQYRMHKDIMLLSNELIYNHQLLCGNDEIATQQLQQLRPEALTTWPDTWIKRALQKDDAVIFLDTDQMNSGV